MRVLPAPSALVMLSVLTLALAGCGDKDDDTGTGSGDDGGATDGGSADGGSEGGDGGSTGVDGGDEEEMITGYASGRIYVELYDYQTGDAVSWDDYGTDFPFGPIFVGAYKEGTDDSGALTLNYKGQTAIASPTASTDGDPYIVPVTLAGDGSVHLYAALDWDGDTVIGTDEPRGVYGDMVEITADDTTEGVDITIVAPVNVPSGGGCDTMSVRGEAILTSDWVDGDIAVMLLNTDREGPYHSTRVTPTAEGAGASADYDLASCVSYGDMTLVGAWDSNGNGVFDPMDKWGSYVSETDVDGNPIEIGTGTLDGYEVQIPFGDGDGLGLYPFVTASGTLTWADGAFDDLPAGSTVYATALKYRPSGDVEVAALEAYDSMEWGPKDYAGASSLDWELNLPVNSVAFLWFYVDTDSDGVVNEHGEPVGSSGDDGNGRFPTGTSSTTGLSVELASAD